MYLQANAQQEATSTTGSLQQADDETSGSGSNASVYSGYCAIAKCAACGVQCGHMHVAIVGTTYNKLCASCHHFWRYPSNMKASTVYLLTLKHSEFRHFRLFAILLYKYFAKLWHKS